VFKISQAALLAFNPKFQVDSTIGFLTDLLPDFEFSEAFRFTEGTKIPADSNAEVLRNLRLEVMLFYLELSLNPIKNDTFFVSNQENAEVPVHFKRYYFRKCFA
jgi:hypothetical protein